jgi:tRNA A-37 threonylcarbamoyl transferase component Bud32/Icc-related predicted phosphoesterase
LSPNRPFREFRIWTTLRQRGVPLPIPVLAVSRRRRLLWRSAFGSLDLPEAHDGVAWLENRPSAEELRNACIAFATVLRRFHDAGGLHGDLHLRNVLIEFENDESASARMVLIDLDRTRILQSVSAQERFRDLMRFARSLEKAGRADLTSPRYRALCMSTYCAGDRGLRRAMLRWAPMEARRIRRHRFGWWFGKRIYGALLATLMMMGIACADERSEKPEGARWSVIATGDTGRTSKFASLIEGQLSVARSMTEEASRNPVDGLVLLGDNFYWHGLAREHLVQRIRTNLVRPYCYFLELSGPRSNEVDDACGINAAARAPVEIFAVLGNHDIELPESVELQRHVIPDFLPGWRMSKSLAEVYEVAPGVSLILFESELAIDDKEAIKRKLREAVSTARGPWRILVTHRPIATDDDGFPPEGGYPGFVREALAESGEPVQLVLAGHHHSLQVFEIGDPTPSLHIGIGSGSRATPPLAKDHPDARFGALELGFARVDLVGLGDAEERLSVRLFEAPRWPWIAHFQKYRIRAHFDVDRSGQVRELPLR